MTPECSPNQYNEAVTWWRYDPPRRSQVVDESSRFPRIGPAPGSSQLRALESPYAEGGPIEPPRASAGFVTSQARRTLASQGNRHVVVPDRFASPPGSRYLAVPDRTEGPDNYPQATSPPSRQ